VSAIGSQRISKLQLSIGLTGTWRAEAWCDEGLAAIGPATLSVADLSFKGTTKRGGTDAPDAPHVIHIGGIGWDRPVEKSTTSVDGVTITSTTAAISYQLDAGVRLSTVLRDLSLRAGEPIALPSRDRTIGKHWVCVASKPSDPLYLRDALAALYTAGYVQPWRVDLDGVTRFGERTGGAVNVAGVNVIRRDSGAGYAVIGADAFTSVLPGATFEGATIYRLVITERPGNLQAEIWSRSPDPFTPIRRKVGEWYPQLVYGHARTYMVGAVNDDGRLDLDPPADAPHLPPLARVEVWGLGGAKVKPAIGSLAAVCFRDANPARPYVHALEPLANSTPTETTIDADAVKMGAGAAVVIREGDKIAIDATPGPTLGTISFIGTSVADHSKVKA
jgi:hypothetical protein